MAPHPSERYDIPLVIRVSHRTIANLEAEVLELPEGSHSRLITETIVANYWKDRARVLERQLGK